MNKYLTIGFISVTFLCPSLAQYSHALPNPWIDCGGDIYCASPKARFNFPNDVKNFPLDKNNIVVAKNLDLRS